MPETTEHQRPHEWRALFRLAAPIAAVNVGIQLMAVVDTAFSGRISDLAQAGTGLGVTIFFFGSLVGTGIVMGLDPLASQSVGAGRTNEARHQLWQGVWLAVAISIPLMAATYATGRALEAIGIAPELATEARRYLDARLLSLVPLLVLTAMRSYLLAIHKIAPLLVTTILANVFNVAADWVLIFGDEGMAHLGLPGVGLPALGVTGLGIATTLAATLQALMLGVAVGRQKVVHAVARRPNLAIISEISRLGGPIGVQMVAEIGIFSLAGLLAARMGVLEAAAHHIALQLAALTFMVPLGVGQAASVRVGNAIGARDAERMRKAATAALAIGTGFMGVAALCMWTIPEIFAQIMSGDPAVVTLATRLIIIAGAFQLFDGIQVVSAGVLRGAGLTRWSMVANLVAYWVVACPLLLTLGADSALGVRGIWIGLTVGLFVAAVLLVRKSLKVTRHTDIATLAVIEA
jgi:MATE family multidrug resistance protein